VPPEREWIATPQIDLYPRRERQGAANRRDHQRPLPLFL